MLRATSSSVVAQLLTEIRSTARPRHRDPDIQAVPSASILRTTFWVCSSLPNDAHTWVNTTSFSTSAPTIDDEGFREDGGVVAEPVHQLLDAAAPQRPEHRPDRDRAAAARELGHLLERVPRIALDQVVAVHAHRRPQRGGVGHDGEPAVVGHVERLVGVGRPGVGCLVARREVPARRRGRGEEPERAVDVHPRAVLVGHLDRLGERVEGAGVHVAGLEQHDRRTVRSGSERGRQRFRDQPALVVRSDDLRGAEAEVAQGQVDAVVTLGADDHPHPRRTGEPVGADVPALAPQHLSAGRGQAGEVGHRGSGGVADRAGGGEPQQVEQPGAGHVLHGRVGRSQVAQAGVLVPGAGQPVGGQRCRVAPADDHPVEAPGRHRGQAGLARTRPAGRRPRWRRWVRSGSSVPSRATISSTDACGGTGRSSSEASQVTACSWARASAASRAFTSAPRARPSRPRPDAACTRRPGPASSS